MNGEAEPARDADRGKRSVRLARLSARSPPLVILAPTLSPSPPSRSSSRS